MTKEEHAEIIKVFDAAIESADAVNNSKKERILEELAKLTRSSIEELRQDLTKN